MPDPEPVSAVAIIPARWASSRFPGKPLHPIAGVPLIRHVWDRCRECPEFAEIVVATDDRRIADAADAFGARVVMTRADHPSGTDRVAEAAAALDPALTHVVNVQGDEPLVSPQLLGRLVRALADDRSIPMITAANPIADPAEFADPNVVKVVLDARGDALYFSRSPIPHRRDAGGPPDGPAVAPPLLRHHGIYGFRRDFLGQFVRWSRSPLEAFECLEQLRALENGARIRVLVTEEHSIGVDTPDQVAIVERRIRASSPSLRP